MGKQTTTDELLEVLLDFRQEFLSSHAQHTMVLDEHMKILNEHMKILKEHSTLLNEHSRILNEHSMALNRIERRQDNHGERITTIEGRIAL